MIMCLIEIIGVITQDMILDKDGIGDVPYRPVKLFSYIVNRTPETIILLRSLFIDIIDFSEKVSPVFTPDNLLDNNPLIKRITW